jgi:hypothetical protein
MDAVTESINGDNGWIIPRYMSTIKEKGAIAAVSWITMLEAGRIMVFVQGKENDIGIWRNNMPPRTHDKDSWIWGGLVPIIV